jgi:hypothetical protein
VRGLGGGARLDLCGSGGSPVGVAEIEHPNLLCTLEGAGGRSRSESIRRRMFPGSPQATVECQGPAIACRRSEKESALITCVVTYTVDSSKLEAFEAFARSWIRLVNMRGGTHHGYFLPAEGASDHALALFSFPSLAQYETYRAAFGVDPEFVAADRIRDESGCVLRWERTFMRPVLEST